MAIATEGPVRRLTLGDLESIIERALEEARARGASQAEAAVSQDSGLSVGVRLGEVETLEHQRDRSMGITVYFGHRKGSASTADFSPEAVRATVAKACSIARFTAEDTCSGLGQRQTHRRARRPTWSFIIPRSLSAERAIEIAKSCEAAALGFDARINNSEGASVATHQGLHVYGNTHGFIGGYPTTSHTVSCVVLAGTGDGHAARLLVLEPRATGRSSRMQRLSAARGGGARSPAWVPASSPPGAPAVLYLAGDGARPDRAFHRGHSRQQPVPPVLLPVERRR